MYLYEKGIFKIPENADKNMVYDGCHCGICHMTILPNGDVYASNSMSAVAGKQANDDTSNVPSVLAGLHMYCIAKFNVDLIECVFVIAILLGAFP